MIINLLILLAAARELIYHFTKSKSPSVFLRTKVRSLLGLLDAREILTNFSAQRIARLEQFSCAQDLKMSAS